jgi:hypothetical protein
MPAGFGWFLKYWRPRALYAGVMPADRAAERELRQAYRKLVLKSSSRCTTKPDSPTSTSASSTVRRPGLVMPYLAGDEVVRTTHLSPEGQLHFRLPGEQPRLALDIGHGPVQSETVLQTVMIHMDEREVDLVWRAAIRMKVPTQCRRSGSLEVQVS